MFGEQEIVESTRAPCVRDAERLKDLVDRLTDERQRDRRTIKDLEEALARAADDNARLKNGEVLSAIPCPSCDKEIALDRSTRADGKIVDYMGRCLPCDLRLEASGIGEEDARSDLRKRWATAQKGDQHAPTQ